MADRSTRQKTRFIDLTGQRFGRLVAVERIPSTAKGHALWRCQCDCGQMSCVQTGNLRSGQTTSCGCYSVAMRRKHGMLHRPEYRTWSGMRDRCNNPNAKPYPRYGGRGIYVCDRWDDFATFIADMGPRPSPDHSLDRIDNDGPYSPDNCRWATDAEQRRNTRRNRYVTYQGRTMTLADWAQETGISASAIGHRIDRGWPMERVMTEPAGHYREAA